MISPAAVLTIISAPQEVKGARCGTWRRKIRFPNDQVGDLVDVLSREPLVLVTE